MARPQKAGSDYFPLDVGILRDKDVRILKNRYGADGVYLYIYLLCEIYKEGYYIVWDDEFSDLMESDTGMGQEKIGQIRNYLLSRSLFDNKLFQSVKVLTARSIQRRYQVMVKTRAMKNAVTVDQRFWLLSEEETQDYIKVSQNDSFSEKNQSYSEKNRSYSEKNPPKVKENKIKEKKENNTKRTSRFTPPTLSDVEEYCKERGNDIDAQHFIDYYSARNWYSGKTKLSDWKACVRTWEARDKKERKSKKREDTMDSNDYGGTVIV